MRHINLDYRQIQYKCTLKRATTFMTYSIFTIEIEILTTEVRLSNLFVVKDKEVLDYRGLNNLEGSQSIFCDIYSRDHETFGPHCLS